MNVVIWYKEGHKDKLLDFPGLENVNKVEVKNVRGIVSLCNCLTVYTGFDTIHIPFDDMKKFKVEI